MKNEEKKKLVKELVDKISSSQIILATSYTGLTAGEMTDLRKKVRNSSSEYIVSKNTLSKIAFQEMKFEKFSEYMKGPVGLVFGLEDPVAVAKTLKEFKGEHERFNIIAGLFNKDVISKDRINELASLPSRNVLIQKVASGIQAPLYNLVFVLNELIRRLPSVLMAVSKKK